MNVNIMEMKAGIDSRGLIRPFHVVDDEVYYVHEGGIYRCVVTADLPPEDLGRRGDTLVTGLVIYDGCTADGDHKVNITIVTNTRPIEQTIVLRTNAEHSLAHLSQNSTISVRRDRVIFSFDLVVRPWRAVLRSKLQSAVDSPFGGASFTLYPIEAAPSHGFA